ncbi:unnamed protein product [Hyaloperonospora brassicae]|uniref:Uncharacterized protein n=1 Tax=Hyaloperonospora brassicae TaxID=162125 RepID=A0AAV0UG61_HYABA|nr:unnamed protein product [Hyaloperonospora brassicae]
MLRPRDLSLATRAHLRLRAWRTRTAPATARPLRHPRDPLPPSARPFTCCSPLSQPSEPATAAPARVSTDISAGHPLDARAALVARLKTQCNALYVDNAAFVPPAQALAQWHAAISSLASASPASEAPQLAAEVERAYESAVAIASKQRQTPLAAQLVQQMAQLGYRPTARTHAMLVRNVALQLRPDGAPATSTRDLRTLLQDVPDDRWPRELLRVLERETRPLQLRTAREVALFHERLIAGVEAQLSAYERTAADATEAADRRLTSGPYHEALRVYADNGVPFARMLQLMVARRLTVGVETYGVLLLGARWNEIPATLSQLLQSKLVDDLVRPRDGAAAVAARAHVHRLWVNAMKAVVHSSTERFNALAASVSKRDVDQLRKVFTYVDRQLADAFGTVAFDDAAAQRDDVYAMRAKAAAACGLRAAVQRILNEYVQSSGHEDDQQRPRGLSTAPFLMALEVVPWALMDVLTLSRQDALARAESRDVAASPRVLAMQRLYDRVLQQLDAAQATVDAIEQQLTAGDAEGSDDELRKLRSWQNVARETVRREARRAATLERRLANARVLKANQLLIEEHLDRADRTVALVLETLQRAGCSVPTDVDLDVHVKLMEQYLTAARRLDRRLAQRQKHVGPHVMRRVFGLVNRISGAVRSGALDVQEAETRAKLVTFFEHAVGTAVRLWCEEETAALVRQQQRLLGTLQLSSREYEQLIFQSVTNLDVRRAHALLQEMHNAGMKPSGEAIHRIALGLLHRRNALPTDDGHTSYAEESVEDDGDSEAEVDAETAVEDDAASADTGDMQLAGRDVAAAAEAALDSELSDLLNVSDRDAIEDELELRGGLRLDGDDAAAAADDDDRSAESSATARTLLLGSDAPVTVEDLVGFLQDWYNLYGVKPFGKTVVPVMAQLLDANNFAEFRRLLQIVDSMDGGLTPATELWLEKRLDRLGGKTLDDFRLKTNNK